MRPDALDALAGLLVAAGVTAALTPVSAMFARRVGAVDAPRERGLGPGGTPLLGGLAIYAGVVVGMLLMLDVDAEYVGVLLGATVITLVGALDDRFDLLPGVKLAGQILAAVIPVHYGVVVDNVTVPFLGPVDFGWLGAPLTVLGMVAVMNIVNFSDGVDGLAAGVAMISAAAFAVIAFDLGRHEAGVLSAVVAGAALGFLVFNFPPASSYMGDCGANLLGLLLACIAVLGAVKTNAVLALILPLLVLAVPFLDTTFVVLKRLKYHRPVYEADREHFHHRLDRIGFSPRRTALYLYAWMVSMAALAIALRFVPYSDDGGELHVGWTIVMGGLIVLALIWSFYLVYVLEIVKFRRLRAWQLRRSDPGTAEHEIDAAVLRDLETGEFEAVRRS
ncbi:MAG: glycosyltransferase family 4 protein [Baekduiaceae bacterium]